MNIIEPAASNGKGEDDCPIGRDRIGGSHINLHAVSPIYVAWTEVYAAVFEVCRNEGHDCVGVI